MGLFEGKFRRAKAGRAGVSKRVSLRGVCAPRMDLGGFTCETELVRDTLLPKKSLSQSKVLLFPDHKTTGGYLDEKQQVPLTQ